MIKVSSETKRYVKNIRDNHELSTSIRLKYKWLRGDPIKSIIPIKPSEFCEENKLILRDII